MPKTDNYVDVDVMFYRATDDAILVASSFDTSIKVWVARSTLHGMCNSLVDQWERGTEVTICVAEWAARKKELI